MKISKKAISIVTSVMAMVAFFVIFQNCGSGGGGGSNGANDANNSMTPAGVGTFIDDAVVGLNYTTTSGLSGVTNSLGQFQFNPGDTVTFTALGVVVGSVTPMISSNGSVNVTPIDLVSGALGVTDPNVSAIAVFLNTLNNVSVGMGTTLTGEFIIPSSANFQSQLTALNTSASGLTSTQLQSALDQAFGTNTYTVTAPGVAQTALQQGIYEASMVGSVWAGQCDSCQGGAIIYFEAGGALTGVDSDGYLITGSWSLDGSGNVSFGGTTAGDGYGQNGVIAAGSTTGTMDIYNASSVPQGTITFTEAISSSPVLNSSWNGLWTVAETPNAYGISQGDQGGCATVMVGPNMFFAITNDGQYFTGPISSGTATGSFTDNGTDPTTMTLSFSLVTLSGTATSNGQVRGTLSLSPGGGSCLVTKNNGGGGQQNNSQQRKKSAQN